MEANDEERAIKFLYDAARRGCVSTLNKILQNDKSILHKISLTSVVETPLHISASHGYLDFTEALLSQNPSLARELDSLKRSPLHLASAEGHTEVVKALLRAYSDACMIPDQDDRIPLHLATMRGRVEVIKELVCAQPNSTSVLLEGDSVFHLCVKYNHLEVLKLLLNLAADDDHELMRGNKDGNTVLHIAAMLNQAKTVQYLLSTPGGMKSANTLNKMNFTVLDFVDLCPRDLKRLEIRDSLMEAGAGRAQDLNRTSVSNPSPTSTPAVLIQAPPPETEICFAKFHRYFHRYFLRYVLKFLGYVVTYQGYNIGDIRGPLMIVATVITTMSFQALMNPPDAAKKDGGDYYFFLYNTVAFISSLIVVLLVISGFPVINKFGKWLLTLAICVSIVFTALTYVQALSLSPFYDYHEGKLRWKLLYSTLCTFLGSAGLVGLFWLILSIRAGLVWLFLLILSIRSIPYGKLPKKLESSIKYVCRIPSSKHSRPARGDDRESNIP